MALALERRFEPFSQGRGFITPQRVEEIETIAARHGIHLAPLYNADGPVEYEQIHDGTPCRLGALIEQDGCRPGRGAQDRHSPLQTESRYGDAL